MLKQLAEWRQTESDCRAERLADERTRLGKAESRLSRLLDVYIDGSIEQPDYARKKEELLRDKTGIRERIRRIEREGSGWIEPMQDFLNDAILAGTTAFSGTEQELRDFHRRIGSNLSMIEPIVKSPDVHRDARASKERAAKSSSRRGGLAARDSIPSDSDSPCPRMRKARSSSAESSADLSQVASVAVTSSAADTSAASGKSSSPVAESHDSATQEIAVRRSSSRWADRPVPVLQVEFPEPWSIIAAANATDAPGDEIAGNLKWWR